MQVLALDFDGVVSDSAREAFVVAVRSYRALSPGCAWTAAAEDDPQLLEGFLAQMPLGNRAEDFAVVLRALERGIPLADQDDYDRCYGDVDPAWLERYHHHFYEERHAWSASDPEGWLASMGAYPGIPELLHRRASDVRLTIATAKDRASVRRLLEAYGLSELFPDSRVRDKESGRSKRAHLESLAADASVPLSELTFVDDKVNHLNAVASLGVGCVLAGWGYNGAREAREAEARGYRVCALENFEGALFGPQAA